MKILFFVYITLLGSVLPCGQITHAEILFRTYQLFPLREQSQKYKNLIDQNLPFIQSGVVFPDMGYLLTATHDAAEESHWPPFMGDAITYLKATYPVGSHNHDRLLVFLLGVSLHYESDVIWHFGLESGSEAQGLTGFLRAMTQISSICEGAWNDSRYNPSCHNAGDKGGDFILAKRNENSHLTATWSVPVFDIEQIFLKRGDYFPEDKLQELIVGFYALDKIISMGGGPGSTYMEKNSAFLAEEFDLFFHGGLDDMALSTAFKWEKLLEDYETGNVSSYFNNKKVNRHVDDKETLQEAIISGIIDLFAIKYQKVMGVFTIYCANPSGVEQLKYFDTSKIGLTGENTYDYFGQSIVTGNFGIGQEVLVSAPGFGTAQQGAVYSVSGGVKRLILKGNILGEKFGYSMTIFDYNNDGIDDLAVSSPFNSPIDFEIPYSKYYPRTYEGKVFVFLGKKGVGLSSVPDVTIKLDNPSAMEALGLTLSSSDCDNDGYNDLIIGSPMANVDGDKRGRVSVLLGSNKKSEVIVEKDLINFHGVNYDQLGYSAICSGGLLIVGAPGHREKYIISGSGAVFGYSLETKEQVFKLAAKTQMARFGKSLTIWKDLLIVGAPSLSNLDSYFSKYNGAVFLYKLDEVKKSNVTDAEMDYFKKIKSYKDRARFGQTLAVLSDYLFVSAPQFSQNLGNEEGKIHQYELNNLKKESYDTESKESKIGYIRNGRFGWSIAVTKDLTVVGAPFGEKMKGQIVQIKY